MKMTKKAILLVQLLVTQLAFGQMDQEAIVGGTPLLVIMKTMNGQLSIIQKQADDPSKNKASAFLAAETSRFLVYAKDVPPPKALDASKPGNDLVFNGMIDGLAATFGELAAAFNENDNVRAKEIISQILEIKSAGHGQFKKKWFEF